MSTIYTALQIHAAVEGGHEDDVPAQFMDKEVADQLVGALQKLLRSPGLNHYVALDEVALAQAALKAAGVQS